MHASFITVSEFPMLKIAVKVISANSFMQFSGSSRERRQKDQFYTIDYRV